MCLQSVVSGGRIPFPSPDLHGIFHGNDKDTSIPRVPRMSIFLNCVHDPFYHVERNHELKLDLCLRLIVGMDNAESPNFLDGGSGQVVDRLQPAKNRTEHNWLNDGFDLFHGTNPPIQVH